MKYWLYIAFLAGCFHSKISAAQNNAPWNGKKCAVVVTYDDAVSQHLDNALPVLDSLGLKATFYITAYSPACRTRLKEWKKVSASGHELGNHTLFHPCIGDQPGREWVPTDYKMNNYTVRRMVEETRMTNAFLEALDGKSKRTFAFTCGDTKVNDTSFIDLMKNDFVAARSVRGQMHTIDQVKLYDVDCYVVNGETGDQLIAWVKQAMESKSLLVVLFHGVGGGNALNVSLPAHRQFLRYLKQNQKDIWIAPMIQVAEYVKKYQENSNKK
ncbi:MAG: polysaccharide deacetylase family protein [Flavisolibacter sp.]